MNSTLRIVTIRAAFSFDIGNDGYEDGQCSFKGIHGEGWNEVIEYTRKRLPGFRCTIDGNDDTGSFDKSTGNYTGIIGVLLAGGADVSGTPIYYPMPDSDVGFDYSRPQHEDVMTILSFYNKTNPDPNRIKDILFMFDTIPIGLWIALICSFLAFISVLRLGNRLIDRNSRSEATWITTCAFLDQDNFPSNRRYVMLLSLFMSIGIFFAVSFLTNSVSTDLVVIEEPIVVRNYDDIISRNLTCASSVSLNENAKFMESPVGSKEWILFQNIRELPVGKLDPVATQLLLEQKLVIVAREIVTEGAGYIFMTKFSGPSSMTRALIVKDPDAKKYTSFVPFRKDFDQNIIKVIQTANKWKYETGLDDGLYNSAVYLIVESLFGMTPSQSRLVDKVIDMPVTEYKSVGVENMKQFIKSYLFMITFAFLALLTELVKKSSKQLQQKLLSLREDLYELLGLEPIQNHWTVVRSDWYD